MMITAIPAINTGFSFNHADWYSHFSNKPPEEGISAAKGSVMKLTFNRNPNSNKAGTLKALCLFRKPTTLSTKILAKSREVHSLAIKKEAHCSMHSNCFFTVPKNQSGQNKGSYG